MTNPTTIKRTSDRELVVTRTFDGPPRIVFEAWTTPELMKQWWAPRSMGVPLLSCEMDVRTGGGYRLAFGQDEASAFAFYGKYIEVTPPSRLVWTNEEDQDGAVTTVTFEGRDGKTFLTVHELYPSKEAFEAGHGAEEGLAEQFGQLDELLARLTAQA
ncbi:SRPBCC family protein [Brevundimonas sp. BR2-1]|uniref:SRPBCC family protein n=1 Tax=Brevundimonas sp. BR2-1 TaxID=3031123 RepID=UPI0030A8ADE0